MRLASGGLGKGKARMSGQQAGREGARSEGEERRPPERPSGDGGST